MGASSIWHWIILLVVVVLLFGSGRISSVMADVAKGIKSFKKGMADEPVPEAEAADPKVIDNAPAPPATAKENDSSKAS